MFSTQEQLSDPKKWSKYVPYIKLILFLFFVAVLTYGRRIPTDKDIYIQENRFTIRPYKYGLYITEAPSGIFYNFSPYDSYYTDDTNAERRIMSLEETTISNETSLRFNNQSLVSKYFSVLSYFGFIRPTATFETPNGNVVVEAESEDNKIHFRLKEVPAERLKSDKLTLGLSYNEEDFIFDISGNIYSDSDIQAVEEFIEPIELNLKPTEDLSEKKGIRYKEYLFIGNRETTGVIAINLNNESYNDIFINTNKDILEFEVNTTENATVTVELYEDLKSAVNSIKGQQ